MAGRRPPGNWTTKRFELWTLQLLTLFTFLYNSLVHMSFPQKGRVPSFSCSSCVFRVPDFVAMLCEVKYEGVAETRRQNRFRLDITYDWCLKASIIWILCIFQHLKKQKLADEAWHKHRNHFLPLGQCIHNQISPEI